MPPVIYTHDFVATKHLDFGIAYLRQNRFQEAIDEFDLTLNLIPGDAYAHWNKAMALLSLGDYEKGFTEHDWGWRLFDWRGFGPVGDDIDRLKDQLPMWHGEDISDQCLLVYHELGYGDAIMTLRYLPELKRRAEHVTLVIDHSLARLAEQFDGIEIVEKVPDNLSDYDYRIPFFGVLSALHQTTDNIPGTPYISADWKFGDTRMMGIAWSGRTQFNFLTDFLRMLDHDGYVLHSLQKADFLTDEVYPMFSNDFLDTVRLIECMDHVVTVDTATAHLAGAMGHPSVHLLLPFMRDWRWWRCDIWYPTIKTIQILDS